MSRTTTVLLLSLLAGWATAAPESLQAQTGPLPDPGQRVAFITGSTNGLGREVARAVAGDGAHVVVHGRSEARRLALVEEINAGGQRSARFYRADFASLDEVRELAADVERDYDRLDVLVNNAGVFLRDRRMSRDGYELTFQVNYLAHYLLTEELLDLLRRSAPARIVNVSSIASAPLDWADPMAVNEVWDGSAAYGRSKTAQTMHATDLARELEGSGVVANSAHPATLMDTDMVLSLGVTPRATVEEGRDNVLQLIDGEVGSGEFYLDGRPNRDLHGQAWDAGERARLAALAERLVAPVEDQLDAYWAEVSRTVVDGDFEGYAALCHPDAVLVTPSGSTPITEALAGWEPGFVDTREGRTTAEVAFRLTARRVSGTTAHETGIFRYAGGSMDEAPAASYLHVEALLAKKDGEWRMTMEYQKGPATAEEWEKAARPPTATSPGGSRSSARPPPR